MKILFFFSFWLWLAGFITPLWGAITKLTSSFRITTDLYRAWRAERSNPPGTPQELPPEGALVT